MAATYSNASTIEHRFKQRVPFHKDVVIYKNHIPIAVGTTHDISIDGMGIKSEMVNIKKYMLLEIELGISQEYRTIYHRLSGLVVYHQSNRFGILFTELKSHDTAVLNQLLQQP